MLNTGLQFYGILKISLALEDDGLCAGIFDRFWPYCDASDAAAPDFSLRVHADAGPAIDLMDGSWRDLDLHTPREDALIPDYRHGFLRENAGVRHIYNPGTACQFAVSGRSVDMWGGTPASALRDVVRVIKQMIIVTCEASGGAFFHAGGVNLGRQSFAVMGDKGAGKTTLTTTLVNRAGIRFVSNDRVCIAPRDGGRLLLGWSDPLRFVIPGSETKRVVTVKEHFGGRESQVQRDATRLGGILFPQINANGVDEDISIAELTPAEGRARAERYLLSPMDPQRPKWLGLDAGQGTPLPISELLTKEQRYFTVGGGYPRFKSASDAQLDTIARRLEDA
jgi:hypothetical protein